ncbi:MAG: hypothetical protein IK077_06785 [Thermoguttaceae bacterium]|nr:hypothetical protein [Thermoguttaceae bacterium]
MTKRILKLVCPVDDSARVARIVGAADKPNLREVVTTLEFDEPPTPDEPWSIGLIVGASGSGKSTVAQTYFGAALYAPTQWSKTRAVVDEFDRRAFEELAAAFAAVGFASQTHWLRPYRTLSAGERFRCDLCKALLDAPGALVAIDEFASLVDETTAKTASIALRNAFDRGAFDKKLVAITHRRDVAQWLEPDWTLDMETGTLTRGRLRRREIVVDVRRAPDALWRDFAPFHYLTGSLNRSARCYAATLDGDPIAFAAIMQSEGRRGRRRVHRLVVNPTWQGIGVGGGFVDALGALEEERGYVLEIVTGSAPFIRRLERSEHWKLVRAYPHGRTQRHKGKEAKGSFGRAIVSFEYRRSRSNKENEDERF